MYRLIDLSRCDGHRRLSLPSRHFRSRSISFAGLFVTIRGTKIVAVSAGFR